MATRTVANEAVLDHAEPASFERFAGYSAIAVGVVGLVYSLAFVVLKAPWIYSLCLLVGGVLTTAVLVAVYNRLRETDPSTALWGLLLGVAGAVGSALHGAYDLANAINAPKTDVLG